VAFEVSKLVGEREGGSSDRAVVFAKMQESTTKQSLEAKVELAKNATAAIFSSQI